MAGDSPSKSLYAGEVVFAAKTPASQYKALVGDGRRVMAGGSMRLLTREKPRAGFDPTSLPGGIVKRFEDVMTPIPRSEWAERLADQLAKKQRISDSQNFPPHDQNGLPTCWANGPAHAFTTMRVLEGLPYMQMSACSVAVPISGGHSGGYEGDALNYAAQHGFVNTNLWGNNDTNRQLMNNAECQADRLNNLALEWIMLGNKLENYITAGLLGWPTAFAYDDWSHVVSGGDGVALGKDYFGWRPRNNWGNWGAKNDLGFYGYVVFAEDARQHSCPDSGFALRAVTPSMG